MSRKRAAQIVSDFDGQKLKLEAYVAKLRPLIEELLLHHGIRFHGITGRVKTRESLHKKLLSERGRKYKTLSDVTDVCALRITTYFSDDVDRVVKLIEGEFAIDAENSLDQRTRIGAREFGYLSVHHIATLSSMRTALPEYAKFAGLRVEIQTRSLLQHAWAEIEHDLGYKSADELPRTVRRRFSRLAGLLELADDEFVGIRDSLTRYERGLPRQIARSPATTSLDKLSLMAFVNDNALVRELDRQIGEIDGMGVSTLPYRVFELPYLLKHGITTVESLENSLDAHKEQIVAFARAWLARPSEEDSEDTEEGGPAPSGISLFYLLYILVAERGIEEARNYVTERQFADAREELPAEIMNTYAIVMST